MVRGASGFSGGGQAVWNEVTGPKTFAKKRDTER